MISSILAAVDMAVNALFSPAVAPADFEQDLLLLLDRLKMEAPAVYRRIDRRPRTDSLERVMAALDSGVRPFRNSGAGFPPEPREKPRVYPARIIVSNTVFYARVDHLDETALRSLAGHILSTERLRRRPSGAILDLRNAQDGDYSAVSGFLALFQQKRYRRQIRLPESFPAFFRELLRISGGTLQKKTSARFFHSLPLVVLCGSKTSGPPELLAALLEQSGHAVTMGEKTAGHVFPLKTMECGGRKWLIPRIDDPAWISVSPEAHEPPVRFDPYPQFPFEKMGKIDLYENDEAIRRAVDLIHSLHAVRALLKK